MKNKYIQTTTLAITTLAATLLMTGCKSSSGYKQADKTGAGIAEFRTEIVNAKTAVDGTIKALDQVAMSANTDPRPAFEAFSKEVKNLESVAAKAQKRGQEMKANGDAYFANWEQQLSQVKDEDVRKLANERKAKLQQSFAKIREYTQPLKDQFDPWMSSLKDLQAYLSQDLTVNGVDAAKKLFAKAKSDGTKVQKSMDSLIEELNTLSATLTPAKVEPKPTASN
jgi:DNA repair exonuclease SbcCD ATPase subunit